MSNKLGQHWLLLRGLSRETAHWGEFKAQLQAVYPSAQIHALDLPGTGRLCGQASPGSITEIAEFVRRQAREQEMLRQPLTILALSMGGMVAWEWLQKYPGDVNGAVLINTSFANLSPFHQRLRWRSYGKLARILMQTDVYRRELAIIQLVSNRRDRDDAMAMEWRDIQTRHPVSLGNSLRQIIAAASYRPTEHKPRQPVLLLNSRGDRLVAPACSAAIHDKWQIELHSHPWAGHDLSLDDGIWLANRLKNWTDALPVTAI